MKRMRNLLGALTEVARSSVRDLIAGSPLWERAARRDTLGWIGAVVIALIVAGFVWPPLVNNLLSTEYGQSAIVGPLESAVQAQGYSNTSPYAYWVPPGNCNSTVSANSTGTQGLTVAGASSMPVVQAQTSGTGTNTQTFICNIAPPYAIITANNGLTIVDAVFFYSVQQGGPLGTQVATLGSGTMNSSTVFTAVTYPIAAAGETGSTVTPVRADAGNLAITPVVGSFNVNTTTAGSFFSVKFTPATAIVWKTDLKQILLNVTLLDTAATPTLINSPGVLVHYRGQ